MSSRNGENPLKYCRRVKQSIQPTEIKAKYNVDGEEVIKVVCRVRIVLPTEGVLQGRVPPDRGAED